MGAYTDPSQDDDSELFYQIFLSASHLYSDLQGYYIYWEPNFQVQQMNKLTVLLLIAFIVILSIITVETYMLSLSFLVIVRHIPLTEDYYGKHSDNEKNFLEFSENT